MKALDLAHYIITKTTRENKPVCNLQLQKILYLIQKNFLQKNLGKAFKEGIEPRKIGPVIPVVYYEYCNFGAMSIHAKYDDIDVPEKELIDSIIDENTNFYPWLFAELIEKNKDVFNDRWSYLSEDEIIKM